MERERSGFSEWRFGDSAIMTILDDLGVAFVLRPARTAGG
jgi:hypothetical protein